MHGVGALTGSGRERQGAVCTPQPAPARGHDAAFVGDYRDHFRAVYLLASRVCGPQHAADVTQEVFLRLWQDPGRFDPTRGSLRTFLLTVAHHRSIDALRSENARRGRQERVARSAEVIEVPVDGDLLQQESAAIITAALNDLPSPERDAIITAFYGHRSYRDAAILLGEPEGTIKSRIRAGFKRLRITLADHPGLLGPTP